MRLYIQKGNLAGIMSELARTVKKDREYLLEVHETKTSINKRKKLKQKKDERNNLEKCNGV